MDEDRYPTGSHVDVYWPIDEEWHAAMVLKTRTGSAVNGAKTLCREILCLYDVGGDMQWHSLHDRDVRVSTTPRPVDQSGIADPFPAGTTR